VARIDWAKPAVAAILLGLAALSWWLPRSFTPTAGVAEQTRKHEPDYTVDNFTAVAVDAQGQKQYELSARQLVHYADDGSSELEEPYLIQYREGMAPTHSRARKGFLPDGSAYILLTGDVHVARGRDPLGAAADIRTDKMRVELEQSVVKQQDRDKR
jgi:lipopolysaccharide export system protein LptC